ncbi:MAG: transglutaminase-like domain-containing protein [Candidatus Micrarchaeota archaeon]|nr:transglutaminase-like domain-containing protein [Candidatus Micrarchaeota archaeon]
MRLFDAKGTGIADAAAAQPGYLGSEINGDTDKRAMIDPSNSEIKAIAGKIRDETESEDAQAVAKALFIWMKNNTAYHVSKENPNYTQSAIEVLHSRQGDCDELSFLYISLCRAAGIPARFVEGFWAGKKFDGEYVGHVWAEFYDGQWTPVELATVWGKPDSSAAVGDGSFDFNSYVIENDLAINFGVSQPDHVATFVDGGTSESITRGNGGLSNSYGKRPSFSPYTWYGAESYDSKYIVSCADGTRALSDEMD